MNLIKQNAIAGEPITIKLTKDSYTDKPFFRKGEIMVTNILGRRQYNIITSDSKDKNIWDEDFENALSTTVTLRKLSRWLIIRKIQILLFKFNNQ